MMAVVLSAKVLVLANEWSPSAYLFAGTPTLRANHLESEPLLEGVEVAV